MGSLLGFPGSTGQQPLRCGRSRGQSQWRDRQGPAVMQPTRAHGAHPQAACRQGKHISQIWSAACLGESHLVRRAGHPAHPPLVTLEHSSLLGPPSPCPSDHRKCQQSESQENPLQPTQTGWGCRRGPAPLRPLNTSHSDSGKAGRGAPTAAALDTQGSRKTLLSARSTGCGVGRGCCHLTQVNYWDLPGPPASVTM